MPQPLPGQRPYHRCSSENGGQSIASRKGRRSEGYAAVRLRLAEMPRGRRPSLCRRVVAPDLTARGGEKALDRWADPYGRQAGRVMQRWPRRTMLTSTVATAALAIPGVTRVSAQDATPAASPPSAVLLPRDVILPLDAVQEVVPGLATETATGENVSALGAPVATRSVTFSTEDGQQRLVLSVDRYQSAATASAAFQEGAEMSREVPGVEGEAVPDLGEAAFIGVVTQGDETHVSGGALFGGLIVNSTLQGYEGTDTNKATVAELINRQAEHAQQALEPAASPAA